MNNMPKKLRDECASDPYYRRCLRSDEHECKGRVTYEHCWIYAGKQVQEKWAIIPLCVFHHLSNGLNKSMNRWFSINRMTESDMQKYPKFNWRREKELLNIKFKSHDRK